MADLNKIVDDLSSLTVLEAAELSKMLEEKWGVSAAAPVAVAAALVLHYLDLPYKWQVWAASVTGLTAGLIIGKVTEKNHGERDSFNKRILKMLDAQGFKID